MQADLNARQAAESGAPVCCSRPTVWTRPFSLLFLFGKEGVGDAQVRNRALFAPLTRFLDPLLSVCLVAGGRDGGYAVAESCVWAVCEQWGSSGRRLPLFVPWLVIVRGWRLVVVGVVVVVGFFLSPKVQVVWLRSRGVVREMRGEEHEVDKSSVE